MLERIPRRDAGRVNRQLVNRRRHQGLLGGLLVMVVLLVVSTPVWARDLSWSSIEVEALLDGEGRLRIRERQTMVFDGDWNGGERQFQLRVGQQIELHGLTRIDPATGEQTALVPGDLDRVDHFEWPDRKTLRWRSRRPTDPPFDEQAIIYLLDYTLSGALRERGSSYELDHDFAFSQRPGAIERFTLALELDPAWRATAELPRRVERSDLPPGVGVKVTGYLAYDGSGRPEAVLSSVPLPIRLAVFLAALVAMGVLYLSFRRHEESQGRYRVAAIPARLDRDWLEEHLLKLLPEEVGAIWDRRVGPPEVAATLARLVAEGKLASSVEERGRWRKQQVLALEKLVHPAALSGYERVLVGKLFFKGRSRTDTQAVRKHYRKKGLDLAALLRPKLEKRVRQILGEPEKQSTAYWPWLSLVAVPVLLLAEGLMRGVSGWVVAAWMLMVGWLPILVASCLVGPYRRWTYRLNAGALSFVLPAVVLALLCWGAVLVEGGAYIPDMLPGLFGVLALAVLPVAMLSIWLRRDFNNTAQKDVTP